MYPDNDFAPRRGVMIMLHLCATAGFACATVYHYARPEEPAIHLILPPLVGMYFCVTALIMYFNSSLLRPVARTSLIVLISSLVAGVYIPLVQAVFFDGPPLIEGMPPVTGMLALTALSVFLFLPPDKATRLNFRLFVPLAMPPAIYLLTNIDQLITPRGIDLFLAFGPLILATTGIATFIADLWAQLIKYRTEARYDGLTGLYQRRAGRELVDQAMGTETLGALFVDLDNLKPINDLHGHEAGDHALRTLANVLKTIARPGDMAIRWGGDEFLLVMKNADQALLQDTIGSIELALGDKSENETPLSASVGGTLARPGDDVDTLIDRADSAMYQAKRRARNELDSGAPSHSS